MAFSVGDRVKVADEHSQWRGNSGEVISVSGDAHEVRLDGHGCGQTVPLLTTQLREQTLASHVDYDYCG